MSTTNIGYLFSMLWKHVSYTKTTRHTLNKSHSLPAYLLLFKASKYLKTIANVAAC